MNSELKTNQEVLRNDLIAEVKSYLGYAEDVHADYISVNEKTFDVDYRSRNDEQRKLLRKLRHRFMSRLNSLVQW